ncbi:MAG: metallophosphoesterase [Kiritimatiellae bacterium]|nr:metallophosphoesterase [Kiritimatiellia bacterium]
MRTSRRSFLAGLAAASGVTLAARARAGVSARHDPSLAVFISDLHLNGLKGEVPTHLYEEQCFVKTVAKILALDPLPAHAVCFGDIAYHWGQPEDYVLAAKLFQPLLDAGIKLTLGLGNHDRRDNFLVQWPSYAKSTLVPGRIVSKVEMPYADLLMLDTINAKPVEKKKGSHPGECGKEEYEWLAETLKAATKPVLTCSHHRPNEDKVGLAKLLHGSPACKGHVYGHWHRWFRDFIHQGWDPQKVFPISCLPSTGHWGDIGFATFRTYPDRAVLTLHMDDFFFTGGPCDGQSFRDDIVREKNGQTCTFRLA